MCMLTIIRPNPASISSTNVSSIQLPFNWKKLLLSIQLLFDERNIFHQWNFYLSKDIFSWIQLLITETIIFINPASIESKTEFHSSSFYLREKLFRSIQLQF